MNVKNLLIYAAASILPFFCSLSGQGYLELFSEAEANFGLGSEALNNPFFDTSVVQGNTVYSLLRDVGASESAIVSYNTSTDTFSVVATPSQIGAASGGNDVGVTFGFTLINGGTTLRYFDFFTNSIYDTNVSTGVTTLVSAATGNVSASAIFRADGSGYAYDSTADSILSISTTGVQSVLLDSTALTTFFGTDILFGSLALVDDVLYLPSSSQDDLFFYDLNTAANGSVFSADLIDTTSDDVDGQISFRDIFYAPDGLVYFYEGDSDAIFSFDPENPDSTLEVVFDEAALIAGPGSDIVGEFAWLNGQLAWTDDSDGFYVVPEPSVFALIMGLLAFCFVGSRRRQ
ncbi:MAG: hypothetical protein AAF546_04850 [Verrucomicrobiota bacterium]